MTPSNDVNSLADPTAHADPKLVEALKLYSARQLSAGAAAELAGIPVVMFLARLAEFGIDAFRQTEADLIEDLRHS